MAIRMSCRPGYYCKGLGELRLARKDDGRWELEEYTVTPLDDTVKEDEEIKLRLAQYNAGSG